MSFDRLKASFKRDWFIVSQLVAKDFTLRYRRSVLGVIWSVLNPLLMMIVLTIVFSNFLKFGNDLDVPFPLYLILGNTIWALMADSTREAMSSILFSASLIKKVRINKLIFPIEKVLFQVVNFAFSCIAIAVVMIYFQQVPTPRLFLLPLLVVYVSFFSAGLGMILASLAVFFQDVIHLWGVFTTAWMYLTPLFYTTSLLPDWVLQIEMFNPMFHYVQYFRDIALFNVTPSLMTNLICIGMAAATFLVGLLVFKKTEKKFILYV